MFSAASQVGGQSLFLAKVTQKIDGQLCGVDEKMKLHPPQSPLSVSSQSEFVSPCLT